MSSRYDLIENLYVLPTPTGAYHAVAAPENELARSTLRKLLSQPESPAFTAANIELWLADSTLASDAHIDHLYQLQELGLIQGLTEARAAQHGRLEEHLPEILASLAGKGKALLVSDQGFYIGSHGFRHETAEELAGLYADLASLYSRHAGLLNGNLGLGQRSWGLINSGGYSELGFWPLFIGDNPFGLMIQGTPNLNQDAFLNLIWMLVLRYGK